jgi:hypothetical protein
LKPAVDAIFTGRKRRYNRRFLVMCNHYLIDPTACTPAAGWEKGQVRTKSATFGRRQLKLPGYQPRSDNQCA